MFNKIIIINILLSFLLSNNNFENIAFNYSVKNIQSQHSPYSFKFNINRPLQDNNLNQNDFYANYHLHWMPSDNLILGANLGTKFPSSNNNENDFNKIYHAISVGFLSYYKILNFLNTNILGVSINSFKFQNNDFRIRWNSYFFINEFNLDGWALNTTIGYNLNNNFSFINFSNYLSKKISSHFDIGIGLNMMKTNIFLSNIYFGLKYQL